MATALLDAAFRLVSHSLARQSAPIRSAETPAANLTELQVQFPDVDPDIVADAYARAQRLEAMAVTMANAERGSGDGRAGPPLNRETLAKHCPGFSDESYLWAVNDGFILTRR